MSGRRVTGASLLAGADSEDVWPVEHKLTTADRADVMRISLKFAGVGLQVPQKVPPGFESELLECLLPPRLRPTEQDRRTGLLKCQHTILGKLVSRDDIKLVINKTHADGKVTANSWHVHISDGVLEGKPYLPALQALQNEVREHYKPQRLRVLELARSVHTRAGPSPAVTDLAEVAAQAQAASASPAVAPATASAAPVAFQVASPAAAAPSAKLASRSPVEATPSAQPEKRAKGESASAGKWDTHAAPARARVSPVAPTPARDDDAAVGEKRKAISPLPPFDDPSPAAQRSSAAMPPPAARPAAAPAPADDDGDRSWLIRTDARVEYRFLGATQPQKLVSFERALYKLLERSDATTLDALYCELHRGLGMATVQTNEVMAFLAKREADGHIMTDFPEIFRI